MSKKIYCLALLSTVACSGGGTGVAARSATVQPAPRAETRSTLAQNETAAKSTPLEYHDENERDRVFIENAERAIGEYSEFIARAGDSEEYAPAVKRSREQIEDLKLAIDFVRGGAQVRAVH
ncbi:MAG TPA: hypothetical protein VGC79_14040 [Polyangiaceae bacterium]